MGKIIAIANQKGGVGKTTTSVNLAASLAVAERRTLLVDCDPQGNATSGLGIQRDQIEKDLYQLLINETQPAETLSNTALRYLQIIPATRELIGAEIELQVLQGREKMLLRSLSGLVSQYDYIIMDCPPSLGLLTVNALTAAKTVIIPLQCEYYAMEGLSQLLRTIQLVKRTLNPGLGVEGILLTMFDSRNNLCHQVASEVRTHFKGRVFKTVVPRNVRLSESPSHGKPALLYDVNSTGARAYLELAKEVIRRETSNNNS
jgi:chromosome partitioning protein